MWYEVAFIEENRNAAGKNVISTKLLVSKGTESFS